MVLALFYKKERSKNNNMNLSKENFKKVSGYEINIFIDESNYQILKNKAKSIHLTIDEYIENLIKNNIKECKSKN